MERCEGGSRIAHEHLDRVANAAEARGRRTSRGVGVGGTESGSAVALPQPGVEHGANAPSTSTTPLMGQRPESRERVRTVWRVGRGVSRLAPHRTRRERPVGHEDDNRWVRSGASRSGTTEVHRSVRQLPPKGTLHRPAATLPRRYRARESITTGYLGRDGGEFATLKYSTRIHWSVAHQTVRWETCQSIGVVANPVAFWGQRHWFESSMDYFSPTLRLHPLPRPRLVFSSRNEGVTPVGSSWRSPRRPITGCR